MILELATLALAAVSDSEVQEARIEKINWLRGQYGIPPLSTQEILALCLEEPPPNREWCTVYERESWTSRPALYWIQQPQIAGTVKLVLHMRFPSESAKDAYLDAHRMGKELFVPFLRSVDSSSGEILTAGELERRIENEP